MSFSYPFCHITTDIKTLDYKIVISSKDYPDT